jgi:acyl-CoA synthetase (AMP-forming)/AMP-acid ligase II
LTWISNAGVVVPDLVPSALRREWAERGHCPDRDLYALFSERVRDHPRRAAVIDPYGVLDYASLDDQVRRIGAALARTGLGVGDIIAIRLSNSRHAVAAELAVAAVGAVALPYPNGSGTRDTVSLLGRARARAVIVDAADEDDPDESRLPHLHAVFSFGASRPGWHSLADAPHDERWAPCAVNAEDPARILVSSGSETEPKMVAYSHNAMGGGRASYVRALHDGESPMRNLVLVPLGSSMGSCGTSVTIAALGGTLLLTGAFDAAQTLRVITEHRPTHVFGVPTMLRRLADQPPEPDEDTTSIRALVSSGAPLPDTTAQACRHRFHRPVINVYGSADGVNCHTARTGLTPETGTGLPDPAVAEIRVVDADGRELPPGAAGEIQARGPMTPLCYVHAPDLDARYRTHDGWVRTGDHGSLDSFGRLHVLGRIKQVIVRGGYNISPAEVECQLGTHPGIAEVACVAVPDADLGERLCACVALKPDAPALTLADITAYLERERGLERRKLPEFLLEFPVLPLGSTGKISRRVLSELATERLHPTAPTHR